MFKLTEKTTETSVRRLNVLYRILNSTDNKAPFCFIRKFYSSSSNFSNPPSSPDSENKTTYVRIGNSFKEIKLAKSPEKIPRGYLTQWSGVMSDSQSCLKLFKWLMQKDSLKQDSFLIGSPTGIFRRTLAMSYAELTQREVEYLCLTRDTTEADIKQRRDIVSSSVLYANQCAVNAALNGRILIIEGIEKAERNLLPILNNLLENRELNLDDGHFLVAPERYDKLASIANQDELSKLNLLRVHEDFRVIALGLPVPKYKGNPLDPPLRSRFQAHIVTLPEYEDFFKHLTTAYKRVSPDTIKNLCDFSYSFYTKEMEALNLPDFPVENVDKIVRIMNNCSSDFEQLNPSKLINRLYPQKFILKEEESNKNIYFNLMNKFGLPKLNDPTINQLDYQLVSIFAKGPNLKSLQFKSVDTNSLFTIDVISGNNKNSYCNFIMNAYHSSLLVDMALSHSSAYDFCLIGPQGSGKTELIRKFASLLDYNIQTIYMYKDMTSRDLIQQRITETNGDTKWLNSALVDACLNGDCIVLDGIHRLRDDTLMSIRRLIQDRELDLLDGRKLLRHDKYDELISQFKNNDIAGKVLRIHPSFRLIATAEPPSAKSSLKPADSSSITQKAQHSEWLTSEILNLFLFHHVEPLDYKYEHEILSQKFKMNEQHERLFDFINRMREKSQNDNQLKHISKFFSLRNLNRLTKKLEKYPELDLGELIENLTLQKFMPQLNKQTLSDFFSENKIKRALDENNIEFYKQLNETNHSSEKSLKELAKIPDTLFYENKLHSIILNNIIRDFNLDENLLLIGNQGTGKNKLVDKFLMLIKKPREYIQLHRDTTVNSLTVQPVIKAGCVTYEDSPLVKAVRQGYVLVVDEADKAPLNVICILKSLIESGEMILSDGRRICSRNESNSPNVIPMHKDFRMIILANRPGFPFLGNDFFNVLGDLLSCHPVDNPDMESELKMLKMYAPSVSENVLSKLVAAFSSLRKLSDQGLISYPFSTREIVNIAKHLEKFPNDSLASVIANVSDFDHFSDQNDLKNTFREIMHKHGIPFGTANFAINLAQQIDLPKILPSNDLILRNLKLSSTGSVHSIMNLSWNKLGKIKDAQISSYQCNQHEARVDSFSEMRSSWTLNQNQKLISDFLVVNQNETDLCYISGIKPLSITQINTRSNEAVEINLNEYFYSAWRTYYPRTKLFSINDQSQYVLLHERTTNDLFKIDFKAHEIFKLEKKLREANSNAQHYIKKAQKSINKFFVDQAQTFEIKELEGMPNQFIAYQHNSNQLSLLDFSNNLEYNIDLNLESNYKLKLSNLTQLSPNSILLSGYDADILKNESDSLEPKNFKYFVLNYSNGGINLSSTSDKFRLSSIEPNLLGTVNDMLVNQIQLKNYSKSEKQNSIILPSAQHYFVQIPILEGYTKSFFCRRHTPLTNKSNDNHNKMRAIQPNTKSIINYENNQILTQISKNATPKNVKLNTSLGCVGYLELIDLEEKKIRYLEVNKISNSNREHEYGYLNEINESEFLFELSPTKQGNFYTLDFNGNLNEWETNKMKLDKSLDEWQEMIMDRESAKLKIEVFKESPNTQLKEFKGPKHGKVDANNDPHVGGNQWAGGSGGFDTAGLGGVGGPYRLDSGNQVFQVSDAMKQNVPENVRRAAKEMGEKAFRERLREINMNTHEHSVYTKYLELVRKPIQQMRNILSSLEAKQKERQWLKNQTQGDLDDSKLVEAITGEKNVYRKRGDDPNADNSLNMEKPKRLRLVVDVSGSMYRFNGVDNRLERELESVLMVMESFEGFESKIKYDIIGHSGDGFNIKFVDADRTPKNEAERLKILKTLIAHSQFCSSGDHTFEATLYAIDELVKEEADDHFVVVLSDANFDRYGLSPRRYAQIMTRNDKVNVYCIFIGALGNQAQHLKSNLPAGKTFVCLNTQEIPRIMQMIFQSAMLKE